MHSVPFLGARACSARFDAPFIQILTLSLSVGCSSTAASARHHALRADYAEQRPPEPSVQGGADPAVAGPVLRRADYVRAVLRSNPSIESARQGWRAAIARVRGAGSFEDPMVDLGVAPLSIGSSDASFGYEVSISQQLPWFGKRSLEASLASAEAEAAKSDYEATKRELALTALTLYDQYFVATRSLEINQAHIELMRAMRDSANLAFASGRGSAQDSLQAESELAHMEHDGVILASERELVAAQMNELLHRAPRLPLPQPPKDLTLPAFPDIAAPRLEAEAVQARPDIMAVRQRAQAEQARAERAERDYYPDFTVSTSYNSMWDMPEHRWMVGLAFNLPIQRGRRDGSVEEARAMRSQFESDAQRMGDTARTQVFVSLKKLEESKQVLRLFETRLLPLARDQIDAARADFVAAHNSFMAVVQAERNLRKVELDYQMARAEYTRWRGELDRALGRIPGVDWEEAER
jgi:outer membrane protein, heavy metal efflux system